jgi:hypothetical protein
MARLNRKALGAALIAATLAVAGVRVAVAQSLLNGYWASLYGEDADERIPGPSPGDYAGLPVNKAAISAALTWSADELTIPEVQCRPHPSIYGFRGIGILRIWEDRDPETQAQTEIETWIVWQEQHRHIYMDGRPHPAWWAQKSWQGFSTGRWNSDTLEVHTDNVRAAWVRRNGLPTDDRATMDERFFRFDDILTHIMMISDPAFLTEPLVKSNEFQFIPSSSMEPYPCMPVDEVPRAQGDLPMHLPGDDRDAKEWAQQYHLPLEAAYGGPQTMFPEYQDYLKSHPASPAPTGARKPGKTGQE